MYLQVTMQPGEREGEQDVEMQIRELAMRKRELTADVAELEIKADRLRLAEERNNFEEEMEAARDAFDGEMYAARNEVIAESNNIRQLMTAAQVRTQARLDIAQATLTAKLTNEAAVSRSFFQKVRNIAAHIEKWTGLDYCWREIVTLAYVCDMVTADGTLIYDDCELRLERHYFARCYVSMCSDSVPRHMRECAAPPRQLKVPDGMVYVAIREIKSTFLPLALADL